MILMLKKLSLLKTCLFDLRGINLTTVHFIVLNLKTSPMEL